MKFIDFKLLHQKKELKLIKEEAKMTSQKSIQLKLL
jgi:hypothetical protein